MAEENLKQKTKTGIYWTFFNQFANNGLGFVVSIVMARLLTPEDYGITALPNVFLGLATVFIGGGFGVAMVRKPDLTEKDISTAFYYSISVGILCYVILFFASPFIAEFFDQPVLTSLVRVTALTFILSAMTTPQQIILQRRLDFKTPARISITTNIVGSVVGITIAYMGYGLWSLVITGVVTCFCSLFLYWLAVRWVPKEKWSKESFKYLWGIGNKLVGSDLLNTLDAQIVPLVIGKFYSPADLGFYNRAQTYASLPASQINGIVQSVTFPVLSKIQDDKEKMLAAYRRMIRTTAFIIFPIMLLLAALAKPVIILMLTEKWSESIIYLQIICFVTVWLPIGSMNGNILRVTGRTDYLLGLMAKKKIIGFVIMLMTLPFGVLWFCLGTVVTQLFCTYLNINTAAKVSNFTFWDQIRDIKHILLLSIFMFLSVLSVSHIVSDLWLHLIIGGVLGIAIYLGAAFALGFAEINDVKYMLSRK